MSMSNIFTIIGMCLYLQIQHPEPVHFATSDAIDVARLIARDLGYPIDKDRGMFYFDLLLNANGRPMFKGYTSIGFYADVRPIYHFEINESTGQVVDATVCAVFDVPSLKPFEKSRRRLTGARPRTLDELSDDVGCDKLRIVRKSRLQEKGSTTSKD